MDTSIELRHLRYFAAVAESRHFGRAADTLGISQPALSQQIRQLERLLDATLLTRTSRTVQLTAAGEVLRTRADETLRRVAGDRDEVHGVAHGDGGLLRIAFVSSAAALLARTLVAFRGERPAVRTQPGEYFTADAMHRVERGLDDVAVVRDPAPRSSLSWTLLAHEAFRVAVPRTHRLAGRTSVQVDELRDEPMILFPPTAGGTAHAVNLQPFRERGIEPDVAYEASHWSTILQLVASGAGVTVVPVSAVDPAPAGVVLLDLIGTASRSELWFAHRVDDDSVLVGLFRAATVAVAAEVRA